MHKKDFDNWNKNKKDIHNNKHRPFYKEREIWWCSLGYNIGFEQDGTGKNFDRPVIILKGFNKESTLIIPLVGKNKKGKFYFYLGIVKDRKVTALLSQIRLIDTKRLISRVDKLDLKKFKKLKTAVKKLLF